LRRLVACVEICASKTDSMSSSTANYAIKRTASGEIQIQIKPQTTLGAECVQEAVANLETIDRKQVDYGRENLDAFGSFGVLIRGFDKINRLRTLYNNRDHKEVNYESVADSWRDLANYALIGLVEYLREENGDVLAPDLSDSGFKITRS